MAGTSLLRSAIISRCKPLLVPAFGRTISTTTNVQKNKNELITLEPIELATGMYKKDILDRLIEKDDPFSVKTLKHGPGSKEEPNMIPSAFESRMVGCICEEDSSTIVWMWLHQGEAKKCQCGFWFKLYYEAPTLDKGTLELE